MNFLLAACLALSAGLRADEPQTPSTGRTAAVPARALDHGDLRCVHLDLLGRPPYRAEVERWLGRGLHELVDELLGSEEFWRCWYEEQLYHFLLIDNFAPHAESVAELPVALTERRLDVRQAVHRICLSASFELRNPGADTFVTVVMEQLAGITVQSRTRELEIGKRLYDGGEGLFLGKLGSSQADVVRIAVESKEFCRTFVEREHRRLLRREADRKELAEWIRRFCRDPRVYLDLLREWMLSEDYAQRLAERSGLPNRLFVRALYVDLLDRRPTAEEEEPLREALDGLSDSAPLRAIVARLMLDSGTVELPRKEELADPGAWIEGLFLRLLGRPCSAEELALFRDVLAEPACRTSTVVYALLSHPDYPTW